MSENQRQNSRYSVSWRTRVISNDQAEVESTVTNVSESGAYLEMPCNYAYGNILLLETHPIIKQKTYTIRIKAKVIHGTILSGDRGFGLGVKFLKIADAEKNIFIAAMSFLESSLDDYKQK